MPTAAIKPAFQPILSVTIALAGLQEAATNRRSPTQVVVQRDPPDKNEVFSAAASFDPDGTIASYSWSFGDGGTGSGVSPTHTYGAAGSYSLTLTVTDNLGAQGTATTTVSISSSSSDQFAQTSCSRDSRDSPTGVEGSYWTDIMRAAYLQGQTSMLFAMREFGMTVFESAEYAARPDRQGPQHDHEYVYDLYRTYLMREPDAGGWAFWTSAVASIGRENVRHAFDDAQSSQLLSQP